MSYATLDEIETEKIGELVRQKHVELMGAELQPFDYPCMEAICYGMDAIRESEAAVINLINDC